MSTDTISIVKWGWPEYSMAIGFIGIFGGIAAWGIWTAYIRPHYELRHASRKDRLARVDKHIKNPVYYIVSYLFLERYFDQYLWNTDTSHWDRLIDFRYAELIILVLYRGWLYQWGPDNSLPPRNANMNIRPN